MGSLGSWIWALCLGWPKYRKLSRPLCMNPWSIHSIVKDNGKASSWMSRQSEVRILGAAEPKATKTLRQVWQHEAQDT